jgi:predicted RNA methylase
MSVAVPKEDIKKEMLFDKVEFDPSKPEEYVKKFAVSNLA